MNRTDDILPRKAASLTHSTPPPCTDAIAAMELSFCEGAPHPRWLPSFSSCPIPALRPT
jgi:hypothetical protein